MRERPILAAGGRFQQMRHGDRRVDAHQRSGRIERHHRRRLTHELEQERDHFALVQVAEADDGEKLQLEARRADELPQPCFDAQALRHVAQVVLRMPAQRLERTAPQHEETFHLARNEDRERRRNALGAFRDQRIPPRRQAPLDAEAVEQAQPRRDDAQRERGGRRERHEARDERELEQRIRKGVEGQGARRCGCRGRLADGAALPSRPPRRVSASAVRRLRWRARRR